MVDIASDGTPSNPRLINVGGTVQAVALSRNTIFVGDSTGEIVAVDALSGFVLARAQTSLDNVDDIAVSGNAIYLLGKYKLCTWKWDGLNFTQQTDLNLTGYNITFPWRLTVADKLLYSTRGSGYNLIDISSPLAPTLISGNNQSQIGWKEIVPNGSGLGVAAVGNNGSPDGPHNISLYDLGSNGRSTSFITQFVINGIARAVTIYNGLAYVAVETPGGQGALQVVSYLPYDALGKAPSISLSPSVTGTTAEEGSLISCIARVTDDVQVRNVEFYVDGQLAFTDGNYPFTYDFYAPALSSTKTSFTLQAKATDTGGNSTWSTLFTYNLTPDQSGPTPILTLPSNNRLAASVQSVSVFYDEAIQAVDTTATYTLVSLGADGVVGGGDDSVVQFSGVQIVDGKRLLLSLASQLPSGNYRLTIPAAAVTDIAGNAMANDLVVNFTARGSVPPNTEYWTNGTGGDWFNASNWSNGYVPGPNDTVIFDYGTFTVPTSGTITAGHVIVNVQYTAPTNSSPTLNITGAWTFNGSFTLAAGQTFTVTGSGGNVTVNGATALNGSSLLAGGLGTKLSFPKVTSYTQPVNVGVSWTAGQSYTDNTGCELNFPALTSITGSVTTASFTGGTMGIAAYHTATLNLPMLTSITVPTGTTASYSGSGVNLTAGDSGVLNAPLLSTFADNSTNPGSSLTANGGGVLALPKLTAPYGIQINLNALSHPEQFTSLAGTASFTLNAGTVAMQLTSVNSLTSITAGGLGTKLSFPKVTSYTQPVNVGVSWTAGQSYTDNTGCELNFPALTSITGSVTTASFTGGTMGIAAYHTATLNLPMLTSITVPTGTTASYSGSGVNLTAGDSGVLNAPLLSTFADNSTNPGSSLTANGGGVLALPKLTAPYGIQINLNALSHPEQFTSLAGTASFTLNAGTVAMQLTSVNSLTSITAGGLGTKLSFPKVTSYTQPVNVGVSWTAGQSYTDNTGCELNFPALTSITGSVTTASFTGGTMGIAAYHTATLNLPMLTSITVPTGTTASYSGSGVNLTAGDSGVLNAPLLSTFADNSTNPGSSLTANGGGVLALPKLTAPYGIQINLNALSHPEQFTSLAGTASFTLNAGTVAMQLTSVNSLTSITAGGLGTKLSFPKVTSYTQPVNVGVSWTAGQSYTDNTGCELNFPALTSITGSVTTASFTGGTMGIAAYHTATLNLPMLTSITVPTGTTASYSGSGVNLTAGDSGVLNAPLLSTFADNSTNPGSSIAIQDTGSMNLSALHQSGVTGVRLINVILPP